MTDPNRPKEAPELAPRTHSEHRAIKQPGRPCTAQDVLAGGQCGNCLWHPSTRYVKNYRGDAK